MLLSELTTNTQRDSKTSPNGLGVTTYLLVSQQVSQQSFSGTNQVNTPQTGQ